MVVRKNANNDLCCCSRPIHDFPEYSIMLYATPTSCGCSLFASCLIPFLFPVCVLYVRVLACVCAHMCTRTSVCVYVCMHVCAYMPVCAHTCIYVRVCACMYVRVCTYVHAYVCVCVRACVRDIISYHLYNCQLHPGYGRVQSIRGLCFIAL